MQALVVAPLIVSVTFIVAFILSANITLPVALGVDVSFLIETIQEEPEPVHSITPALEASGATLYAPEPPDMVRVAVSLDGATDVA